MMKFTCVALFLCLFVLMFFELVSESIGQDLSDEELLKDASGDEVQEVINSYKGDKAVLVNVWAT